jgi:PKD repeat protein
MRLSHSSLVLLTIILFCALPCAGLASDAADVEFSKLPLSFIENQGQKDPAVLFHVEAADRSIFFTQDGVIFSSPGQDGNPVAVSMAVLGYSNEATVEGINLLPGTANFFMGNDPGSWITDVPTYAGVAYREVIPGVDLTFGGTGGTLKREFILSPGVDPEGLVLQYQGQASIGKEADGSLNVVIPGGSLKEAAPVCYQVIGGVEKEVACSYRILGDGLVGFTVGPYNPNYVLVIDPVLDYSTYYGGTNEDRGLAVAVDGAGSAYVTGFTKSTNIPLPLSQVVQELPGGSSDVFVVKLSPDGQTLDYATYLGGSGDEQGLGIAVDSGGNATLTGYTLSCNFPVLNPYQPIKYNCCCDPDAFVTKIYANGSALAYSTFLGGNGTDVGQAVVLNGTGSAIVTGYTTSLDFPNVTPFQQNLSGGSDVFVTNVFYDGSGDASLAFSTYLGGESNDQGKGIALDSSENIFLTGFTKSQYFPTLNYFRQNLSGVQDAFVTKMDPTASALIYSTYLGSLGAETGNGIAVDSMGYAVVAGDTQSSTFWVTPNAFQKIRKGIQDGFVTRMSFTGSGLNFSTYIGGSDLDSCAGIVVDANDRAVITGYTDSMDYPVKDAFYPTRTGFVSDAFVTRFYQNGSALDFSTYMGGKYYDQATGIARDSGSNITITGWTDSGNFPVVNAYQSTNAGTFDVFIARIASLAPVANFTGSPLKGFAPLLVQFNDTSTGGPTSWAWVFGDGNTSAIQNATNLYGQEGNYTVNLTVSNVDGSNTTSKFEYIHVAPPLIVNFSANVTNGTIPLTVNFTDYTDYTNQTPPFSWNWSFGDGGYNNTAQNVTYTYAGVGLFNVSLNVTTDDGSVTGTRFNYILAGDVPVANFTGSPRLGIAPLQVSFMDLSISFPPGLNWSWDFGDGSPLLNVTNGSNVTHVYPTFGNYTVNLTIENIYGSNTTSKTDYVMVGALPVANFTADLTSGVVVNTTFNFTDTSTGPQLQNRTWNFGDGNITTYTSNATFPHIYLIPGNFTVSLTVTNPFGSDTLTRQRYITVYGVPLLSDLVFDPGNYTIPTNSTTSGRLVMLTAENGISGYNITVFFDNPNAAQFVALSPPGWSVPNFTQNSSIPAQSFWLRVVDINDVITPGATNIELARFNMTGITPMNTFLNVTATQMDTDTGDVQLTDPVPAPVIVVALLNIPGQANPPTDPFYDGVYWDLNGDGNITFFDVLLYFNNMSWIQANEPVSLFDYNHNGHIDFNDLILLFNMV